MKMEPITSMWTPLPKQMMPSSVEDDAGEPESWACTRLSKPRLGLKVGNGMGRQGSRNSPSWASTKDVRPRLDLEVRQL